MSNLNNMEISPLAPQNLESALAAADEAIGTGGATGTASGTLAHVDNVDTAMTIQEVGQLIESKLRPLETLLEGLLESKLKPMERMVQDLTSELNAKFQQADERHNMVIGKLQNQFNGLESATNKKFQDADTALTQKFQTVEALTQKIQAGLQTLNLETALADLNARSLKTEEAQTAAEAKQQQITNSIDGKLAQHAQTMEGRFTHAGEMVNGQLEERAKMVTDTVENALKESIETSEARMNQGLQQANQGFLD